MKRLFMTMVCGLTLAGVTAFTAGCGRSLSPAQQKAAEIVGEQRTAIAVLSPTEGSEAFGTVTFIEEEHGIRVIADIQGLEPGPRGFHIHEFGDCSAPDAMSAGGHFDPHGHPHGDPQADPMHIHVGDLGNIVADETGRARMDKIFPHLSFRGASNIIGKSVIVHFEKDDLESQPTGDAGGRAACGVIERL